MRAVTLNAWSPGFVAVDLIKLLRGCDLSLSESHRLATDFAEGQRVSILFSRPDEAEQFVSELKKLRVDAFVSTAAASAH